jgi:N-acetylmuramoyl-L-alanine amidase
MPQSPRPHRQTTRLLASAFWIVMAMLILTVEAKAFDTVIIDPGHGAHDRGAAIGYVYEKHLALDTARRVEQLLKQQGLKVIMSRSRDVFIPLQDRSALGNSRRNSIFVSIHYNYNRGGSGAGAETYYHFSSSYMLAAYIQAYLVQRTSMTNRGVKSAGFHVIRATSKNPAVLVECGFVSNSTERARMMTGEYRKRIAEGIAQGIIAYRKSN